MKGLLLLALLALALGLFGCPNPQQTAQLVSESNAHTEEITADAEALNSLIAEETALVEGFNNADSSEIAYSYYARHLAFTERYLERTELAQKHLEDYELFMDENGKTLGSNGAKVAALENNLAQLKLGYLNSAKAVKRNGRFMADNFEGEGALEEQHRERQGQYDSRLDALIGKLS